MAAAHPASSDPAVTAALDHARHLMARHEDEAAKHAYIEVLTIDPRNFAALNEIGILAAASGHRSAARSAYARAVSLYPGNPVGRVNLGNLLLEDHDFAAAREHYQAALTASPALPEAHRGLAQVLTELGDPAAEAHWQHGFAAGAIVSKPFRGTGPGVPILLLVAARGGNIPSRHWIDDHRFAIHAVYTDFHDPAHSLPPHALIVNLVGDADLCGQALRGAEMLVAGSRVPVINAPALVAATGRAANASRLGRIPGVITPRIEAWSRAALLGDIAGRDDLRFPLLLRAPGFHTGRHFHFVESQAGLALALGTAATDEWLVIQYLEARGPDGMARKYRVMFIGGEIYPVHLAISPGWKVHYYTAAMAGDAAYRQEESRFLNDMACVLGARAMAALTGIGRTLALDYAGADFALSPDGSVLLFEANATMVITPPDPDPIWDYRRDAIGQALRAAQQLLAR